MEETAQSPHSTSPNWLKAIVIAGLVWGQIVLLGATVMEPTAENLTLCFSIIASGLYTVLLYRTRERWRPRLADKPLRNAVLLGIFNAALIETIFLLFEKLFGAQGMTAHPNLLVDLALTMPWYAGMVYFFCRIQERYQYPDAVVLMIGAVYELGADGIVGGQVLPILTGTVVNLWQSWIFLLVVAVWQFIPVYSSMLLPCAWLLDDDRQTSVGVGTHWLRPLWWLIPYSIYLIAVLQNFFADN